MKKFKELLIAGISEDIHGTTIERFIQVKQTFEREMIYNNIKPSMELLTQWLQGLPWAFHVPYENHAIIEWYQSGLRTPIKESQEHILLEKYWHQCGRTLYELLYK